MARVQSGTPCATIARMTTQPHTKIPTPNGNLALKALQTILRTRSPLPALEVFHGALGKVFRANLPSFKPIMTAGAEWARWLLVEARESFLWKAPKDPIARLLRDGLLVADGEMHDSMRRLMNPALHRNALVGYVESMWRATDRIAEQWQPHETYDMLPEVRKIALLIVMETLFSVDFMPHITNYWAALLHTLRYISPGIWVLWADVPRPNYRRALRHIDNYLHQIIRLRRAHLTQTGAQPNDLLGILVSAEGVDDAMIRDQMLTMIIAGHDTSTGLLAWAMYMIGADAQAAQRLYDEVDSVLGDAPPSMEHLAQLKYLDRFIDETLRLYPPAHLGSRIAAQDLTHEGYLIRKGERVTYSIYVTHRMADYWQNPGDFYPDRFLEKPVPYSFLPFGGGARNCIGAAFAQVEAKVILARLVQRYRFTLLQPHVHMHMAVTLEPRPGVIMRAVRR
ncbi:MAG: cytochrome P450 [Chloroflexi bacterium CFX4]|nr:cytochrome P450 [Chloroflexi bacterium CFX4]MDL1921633.1 cytochrome P450 [Chloroflexi bacterium CFX3]